jgi:ADP-heptose:LPS heptosyltransferase
MNLKKMLKIEGENLDGEIKKRNDAKELLISVKYSDGHIHHILPDESVAKELVEDAASQVNLDFSKPTDNIPPDEIVFKNRQAFGDILTMTCAIRDFKSAFPQTRIGVLSTAMHIWDHNPHVDHNFRDTSKILEVGPGFLTNKSNLWNLHMCNAFRVDIENKTHLTFPQGPIRPDIWMTEEEYKRPPLIDGPYWIFIYGGEPGWPAKQYHRWQEVINILKDDIQIVQLGVKGHPYPHLENVIDYIGKTEDRNTGIRDLFNLFLHSQGSLGLVSMHMHLSAAFGNPCVVLAGAREPAWFTNYFGHQYIQTNGTLPCGQHTSCWKCKLEGCTNLIDQKVPKCVEIIEPEEIAEGVRKYYKGGRLEYGKKIPNKFFKNIAREPRVFVAPKVDKIDNDYLDKWGFKFGGGSITDRDWMFMKETVEKYKVKKVLEFGAGLSSLLLGTITDQVITYETTPGWIKKISQFKSDKNIILQWNGKQIPSVDKFDMVFVDGPSGGVNREWSTKYASELSDLVIVHDAGRKEEREWQAKYLENDFELIAKGGHRCHLWRRKTTIATTVDTSKPLARVLSTCRGYGGSERSTIYIMKMLLEKGYRVELVPTGNISGEYLRNIPDGVIKQKWGPILKTPAELTVFYTSDTIWNFNKPEYHIMNYLNTKRKVMVVNYKLGGVGQVDWTFGWDKYMFLNSEHEGELIKRIPNAVTKVLPPPTDLTEFFKVQPYYGFPLKLIRHSSQGDNKYRKDNNDIIFKILEINPSIEFHFMPPRSDCIDHPQIFKYPKNQPPVYEFLKNGNCFLYLLPKNYSEGGPRVLLECAAAGLPSIVDNHSGMKDRVTDQTGWKCNNSEDYLHVIQEIMAHPELLKIKGEAAREKARKEFVPERWIEEIIS